MNSIIPIKSNEHSLEPPTLYILSIENWHRTITSDQYQNLLKSKAFDGMASYNFTALLMPIRTHSLKGFLEDLSLPIFFNLARRVDSVGLKILACFFSVGIDLVTLPIRLLTAIPRFFLNKTKKEDHLFFKFLKENKFNEQLLNQMDTCHIGLIECSKKFFKPIDDSKKFSGILGMLTEKIPTGFCTTYKTKKFKVNFVEQAFVYPQFPFSEFNGFGRQKGSELYKKYYLEAYPSTTEAEFEEIDKLQNKYLINKDQTNLKEYIKELKKFIPDYIEQQNIENNLDYLKAKKAHQHFLVKFHPDKGGNQESFIKVFNKWKAIEALYAATA